MTDYVLPDVQVVIILCPESEKNNLRSIMSKFDSPYLIVSVEKMSRLSSQNDLFAEKVRKLLKRTLIRAGSIPYVHTNLAIV